VVALYITSTESSGKTAFCAGISKKLLDRGAKVGFMMPVHINEAGNTNGCADALFMKDVFKLAESQELICPLHISKDELLRTLTEGPVNFMENLKQTYHKISGGKDVVVLEGLSNLINDKVSAMACYAVSDALEAGVIILTSYPIDSELSQIEKIGKKVKYLIGVIVNQVPKSKIERVKRQVIDFYDPVGIKVLGVVPEIRSLLGVTVGELAKALDGEILVCPEKSDEIVENVMLGAMTVDSGLLYYNRKENKAVIARGERADMQLAALQTSTKCLVVTDHVRPLPVIVVQAQEKRVPIISVKQDTVAALAGVERALVNPSFHSLRKLEIFNELLGSSLNLEVLYTALGLKN
jgi:BioD-like phosphotransacetylase family protein